MIRKFKKFTALSSEEKKFFFEAYVTLGKMRVAMLILSFKRLTRELEHRGQVVEMSLLDEKERDTALKIGQAIVRASVYTLWESACLVQSLAAQKMLHKRGIPGVVYLGAAKDDESEAKMKIHAWTQCGDTVITGGRGHEMFTVLSVFGWGYDYVDREEKKSHLYKKGVT